MPWVMCRAVVRAYSHHHVHASCVAAGVAAGPMGRAASRPEWTPVMSEVSVGCRLLMTSAGASLARELRPRAGFFADRVAAKTACSLYPGSSDLVKCRLNSDKNGVCRGGFASYQS